MITIYMTEKIDEYDKLIEKYETISNSDPSSYKFKVGVAELWEMSDPTVLLKKKIIDKLGDLPCDKLENYEKFFGGPMQTGDILYPLPEASTTRCSHNHAYLQGRKSRDCYRKGNLLHTVQYTHKGITPRHHTQALSDTLREIKQKRDDMGVTVSGEGKKKKNSKKKKTTKKKRKKTTKKKKKKTTKRRRMHNQFK